MTGISIAILAILLAILWFMINKFTQKISTPIADLTKWTEDLKACQDATARTKVLEKMKKDDFFKAYTEEEKKER
jgi:uncharacterized protein YoxC